MGEALITRRGGGGGGGGIELTSYDVTLSANGTTKMRVLVDTNGWEPGLYRAFIAYFSDNVFYTFCPYIHKRTNGNVSYGSEGANMVCTYQDRLNYPDYSNSPTHRTCNVGNYSPSTGVYRLEYTFDGNVNNGTIEILHAKFYKIAL